MGNIDSTDKPMRMQERERMTFERLESRQVKRGVKFEDTLRQPMETEKTAGLKMDAQITEKKRKLISSLIGTLSGVEIEKLEKIISGNSVNLTSYPAPQPHKLR